MSGRDFDTRMKRPAHTHGHPNQGAMLHYVRSRMRPSVPSSEHAHARPVQFVSLEISLFVVLVAGAKRLEGALWCRRHDAVDGRPGDASPRRCSRRRQAPSWY
eukprot:365979-Chlamydomonas_euryale.AAC.2